MDILSQQQMRDRLDFMRPLHKKEDESPARNDYPIPFEYGSNEKGTRISVSKAKVIAAELLKEIALVEKEEILRYFKREEETVKRVLHESAQYQSQTHELKAQIAVLERRLRNRRKK
jgi:hypothetical protein